MPVATSYPGVYVQELASGVRTIVGVSTSIAMFIGRAANGELSKPIRCLNFADFERTFSTDSKQSDLPRQVKLFFDNGGTDCYVMRIANGAKPASVMLKDELQADTLKVTAKSYGLFGNDIRVSINYNTALPESTFNLEVFRWAASIDGSQQPSQIESYPALSMDTDHPRYCEKVVNPASKLIHLDDQRKTTALTANGQSISGFAISAGTDAVLQAQLKKMFDPPVIPPAPAKPRRKFRISINRRPSTLVDLSTVAAAVPATEVLIKDAIQSAINAQLSPGLTVQVSFEPGPTTTPATADNALTRLLKIDGVGTEINIEPASDQDLAVALMLGTAQGGIEVSRAAGRRPAPTGVVTSADLSVLTNFAEKAQSAVNALRVGGVEIPLSDENKLQTSPSTVSSAQMYQDKDATDANDGRKGVQEKLAHIASAINRKRAADPKFKWRAEVWGTRLAILAVSDVADLETTSLETGMITSTFAQVANVLETTARPVEKNVRYYALAAPTPPASLFYTDGVKGDDGKAPQLEDYENAYGAIDREVDLFNLMLLPHDTDHEPEDTKNLWGGASNFCERRRAFLLIDPPREWSDHNDAIDPGKGVRTLRVGLSKQHSAVYFPNLTIREGAREIPIGPSGAIAGLMARIDGTRGVWKAAAGTEADLRGIVGLERRFSDGENGVMNPRAVNTIRVFPNGIVSWGARTMDGDDDSPSDYKYIPIRRLALYMEESLYRGLKWVVFELNDEPLYSQIRLNVGAFMHNLFRQGAFQGKTPRDAYFVKCDNETTTQNDRNLGIVNIMVGFAPLKPAEFVILYLQQIAGQIEV